MATSALGRNLRSAREAREWSRETLARESGTSVPAISRTELYGKEPRLSTLYQWARALDVDPAELLPSIEVTDLEGSLAIASTPKEVAS